MKYLSEHYRDFPRPDESPFRRENKRFVYQTGEGGGAVEVKIPKEKTTAENLDELFPEDLFNPEDENTPNTVWDNIIYSRYKPNSIKTFINATVDKILPEKKNLIDKNKLVTDAVSNYSIVYEDVKIKFFGSAEKLQARFNVSVDRLKKKTGKELGLLRNAIERDLDTKGRKEDIIGANEELATWLDKDKNFISKGIAKRKIKNRFENYVDSMNEYYLNYEWQSNKLRNIGEREPWNKYFKGIPIFYPYIEKNKAIVKYGELAEAFQENMHAKIAAKVEYVLGKKNINAETLKKLQINIENEYKKLANLDGRPGMLDFRDLLWLEYYSSGNTDILEKINTDKGELALKVMESTQLMSAESWEEVIDSTKEALLRDAVFGAAEGQFIKAANKWRGEKAKPFKTYSEAKDYFEEKIDTYAKIDAGLTLKFIKHFDKIVNKNRVEALSTVEPPSLQLLVYYERKRMVKGRYEFQSKYDEILANFIASTREGREIILDNKNKRAKLLKAIRNAQVRYPEEYANKYQKGIPEKMGDLRTRSKDREKPTFHDEAARLQALIVLSKEAEGIIANFSGNKKYKGLDKELGSVQADEKVLLGLKFKDLRNPKFMPYRSSIFRGGFNGRDLSVKILKIAGAITVVVNIANSVRQGFELAEGTEGKEAGIFDKIGKSIEFSIFNPAVAAGAAVAVGGQMLENHPQFYSYLGESEFGKHKIIATARLDRLSKKVGSKRLNAFIGNGSEWRAMEKLKPDQIKELVKKSQKRAQEFKPPRIPGISQGDVEELIGDKTITVNMNKGDADLRFNFYSKFLSGEATNVTQLQEICTKWR